MRRLAASIVTLAVSSAVAIGLCGPAAASSETAAPQHTESNQQALGLTVAKINEAANVAIEQIGDPYRWGATGPGSFDCSGLSMWSYDHADLHLPRTAAEQYASVRHESKAYMVRGDLVFFHDSSGHVYHVGIFLHWNAEHRALIVHAPHTGQRVHRELVWTTAWYAGTRRP